MFNAQLRIAVVLALPAILLGCGFGVDGPNLVYGLAIRNDTDDVRLVVPINDGHASPENVVFVVEPDGQVWGTTIPLAIDVGRGGVLVLDGDCGLVGRAKVTPSSDYVVADRPTFLLVIDDPRTVTANPVSPEPHPAGIADWSYLAERCPTFSLPEGTQVTLPGAG